MASTLYLWSQMENKEMNIKEFTKKYLNIELSEYQIQWFEYIKDMKEPKVILTRQGFCIIEGAKT